MSAKENAEAILIVIKRILKWVVFAVLGIVVLFLCLSAYNNFDEWFKNGRYKKNVLVKVEFDKSVCSTKEYPLHITIVNNSTKTIKSTYIDLIVTKKGYSAKINDYGGLSDDKIIEPKTTWSSCWMVKGKSYNSKLDGENMDVALDYFTVTFND